MNMANKTKVRWTGSTVSIPLTAIILIGAFIFVYFLTASTKKEAEVVISSSGFEVKGMYGKTFSFKDVASIELKDSLPAVGNKTNGSGIGQNKKGYFDVAGMGNCLLYVNSDTGPFIYIKAGNTQIIMNYKDGEKTRQVCKDILAGWGK
jgi:hypothetical protein